jgi:3',5'-cyclic AMP phosphodiesterase CpdA
MRLAHCSDLHLLSLDGVRALDYLNKRWIGRMNLITSRSRHYHTAAFDDMVEDLNAQQIDHLICTGDVTNLALPGEFRYARERFDRLRLGTRGVTVPCPATTTRTSRRAPGTSPRSSATTRPRTTAGPGRPPASRPWRTGGRSCGCATAWR